MKAEEGCREEEARECEDKLATGNDNDIHHAAEDHINMLIVLGFCQLDTS